MRVYITYLTRSGSCEKSSWGSPTSLCDACITQPIDKLFTEEGHVICCQSGVDKVWCYNFSSSWTHFSKQRMLNNLKSNFHFKFIVCCLLPSVRHSGLCVRMVLRIGRMCMNVWAGPSDWRLSRLRRSWAQKDDSSALDPACRGQCVWKMVFSIFFRPENIWSTWCVLKCYVVLNT